MSRVSHVRNEHSEPVLIVDYENIDAIIRIARKRTQWIALECAARDFEMTLKDGLANAYLQGMQDVAIAESKAQEKDDE